MPAITPSDIDFSDATKVISSAQKFVIPVPAFPAGGEPLVYPASAKDKEGQSLAGKPIADWQGKPIGETGIVFFNGKDNAWQAARGDGNAVIILNQVDEKQAKGLDQHIHAVLGNRSNLNLSVNELKDVLNYARNSLGIVDMYNSDKGFIASKMSRVGNDTGIEAYGLHKRDDRDICEAVFLMGKGEFQGPAATPQKFDDGAIVVKQGDSMRLVQPKVFEETYRQADGKPLKVEEMSPTITRAGVSGAKVEDAAPKLRQ